MLEETRVIKRKIDFYLGDFFREKEQKLDKFPERKALKEAVGQIKKLSLGKAKRIRPLLFYFGYLMGGGRKKEEILKTSIFVEILHSYLLIHDDIIDRDFFRRGNLTAWKFYKEVFSERLGVNFSLRDHFGKSLAIVAGDLACTWAHEIILRSKFEEELKAEVLRKMNQTLEEVIYGQFLDLFLPFKKELKETDIMEAYRLKTASYTIEAPFRMGAILGKVPDKWLKWFSGFAFYLGVSFQVKDDILDLFGSSELTGKSLGSDLREGKMTLPLFYVLKKAGKEKRKFILSLQGKELLKEEEIKKAREIFEESGALEKSQELASNFSSKAKALLNHYEGSEESRDFLLFLADYLEGRKY